MKAYILSFDRDDNLDYVKIHKKIVQLSILINWSHYLKSSYIMISNADVNTLSVEIGKIIPNKQFLLLEVNLKKRQGWLPTKAWEWFRTQSIFIESV